MSYEGRMSKHNKDWSKDNRNGSFNAFKNYNFWCIQDPLDRLNLKQKIYHRFCWLLLKGVVLLEHFCWIELYLEQFIEFLYVVVKYLECAHILLCIPWCSLSFQGQMKLDKFWPLRSGKKSVPGSCGIVAYEMWHLGDLSILDMDMTSSGTQFSFSPFSRLARLVPLVLLLGLLLVARVQKLL